MKNNKFINLIVVFFFTLFGFICRVDAAQAQELTCLYKKSVTEDKVLLIQYSDGSRKIFRNEDNHSVDGVGWFLNDDVTIVFEDDVLLDDDNNLKECPKKYNPVMSSSKKIVFYNDHSFFETIWYDLYGGIEYSGEVINEPAYSSVTKPDLSSDLSVEETCSADSWLINELDDSKYTGACLYRYLLDDGSCHLIQVNFGKNLLQATEYEIRKGIEYSGMYNYDFSYVDEYNYTHKKSGEFRINNNFYAAGLVGITGGTCIGAIKVDRDASYNWLETEDDLFTNTEISLTGKGEAYYLVNTKGINPITGEQLTMENSTRIDIIKTEIDSCEDLFGEEIAGWLKAIWNFVKILVPIILIFLGGLDFAQAIFAGKEDDMKKAQSKFIKRIIIAVVIFLIPVLLSLLLNVANSIWGNIGTDICGILA